MMSDTTGDFPFPAATPLSKEAVDPEGLPLENPFVFLAQTLQETEDLAHACAAQSYKGLVILLKGDLGTGKTQFVRFFAEYSGKSRVRSPSFTLVNEYEGNPLLVHADLYRVAGDDMICFDLEEYAHTDSILLVEWAERWSSFPREDVWCFSFSFDDGEADPSGTRRRIVCDALGVRARRALERAMENVSGEKRSGGITS